eukprot:3495789-Rhodomonas_salina.1
MAHSAQTQSRSLVALHVTHDTCTCVAELMLTLLWCAPAKVKQHERRPVAERAGRGGGCQHLYPKRHGRSVP